MAQATDWGTPKDSHPHLCDGCKQKAGAVARPAADTRERQEPVRGETGPDGFWDGPSAPSVPNAVPRSPTNGGRRLRASAGAIPRRNARLRAGAATSGSRPTWT
ncbi:hypothetical protein GCM10010275_55430 [Streptomyces litmocidini]|nr:hypothetical protein GCM10010275_55430 [Streptomyces litmocidini]